MKQLVRDRNRIFCLVMETWGPEVVESPADLEALRTVVIQECLDAMVNFHAALPRRLYPVFRRVLAVLRWRYELAPVSRRSDEEIERAAFRRALETALCVLYEVQPPRRGPGKERRE